MVARKLLLLLLVDASLNLLDAHEEFFFPCLAYRVPSSPANGGPRPWLEARIWALGIASLAGARWREAAGFETPGLFEVLQQGFVFSAGGYAWPHASTKEPFEENALAFEDVKNSDGIRFKMARV